MGRKGLPIETKETIKQMAGLGKSQRAIARELKLNRVRVENVLHPNRVRERNRNHRKPCVRILKLDREEIPEGYFNVCEVGREDWLTG